MTLFYRNIIPRNNLAIILYKRAFQNKATPIKGYTSIRKENDIDTAEYYFENGNLLFAAKV
jgi:hypothetical protein